MIRKFTLLFLAFIGMFSIAEAQLCGFDLKHQQLMSSDPAYAQQVQQMNTQLANLLQSNSNSLVVNTPNGVVYQIPLVVHVIHTGGAIGSIYNPTDAQIISMVNYLNQTYAATWPSYPNASNGGTYIPLQFVLAKRTPTCTATNGITRDDGSSVPGYTQYGIMHSGTNGADEATVKAINNWPNTDYYNIWIVNKIDGADGTSGIFVAGYAYFPGAPASLDGTIMLATQANAGDITLPHEVGHAFNVYHTFEGDNNGTSCPANNNCLTDGDLVCDTDPHIRSNFNCPIGTNACTGNPYGTVVHNFMDYSSCQDRFTAGQETRIINSLLTQRASLISSLGGTPLGAGVTVACLPTASATISGNSGPRNIKISDASVTYMSVTSSGYSGDGNQYYIDKTCKEEVDLTAGQIYTFSVKTGTSPEKVRVYVDYNNDGVWQANELIYTHDGTLPNETHTFQYTVPTTVTVPDLVSCVPLRMRIVSDRSTVTSVTACGQLSYGQAEDYSIVIRGGGPSSSAVAVSLTSGSNPSCFNSPLTFTALPGPGVTTPSYLWYVNGVSTGVTTNTYSSSALTNNDAVTVKMFYIGACGNDTAISTAYTVHRQSTVPATVSIALTNGTNPSCTAAQLTFTATPVNGGTAPTYQWNVNGGAIPGATAPTYTSTVPNNGIVTVDMVSNSSCASPANATSNSIVVTHSTITSNITISLTSGSNPSCSGVPLTFSAQTTNAGNNPLFQWFVNGVAVSGATSTNFTSSTLSNNDVITAVLNATDSCVSNPFDTSNAIAVTINPTQNASVSVAITQGSNPGCLDSLLEFTATVNNHGTGAANVWLLNGIQVQSGLVYSSSTFQTGNIVSFRSVALDGGCYNADTLYSTPIVISRLSTPASPFISLIGNMLVANMSNNIYWFGPSGQIPGATGQTYHPTQPGVYYAVQDNGGCYSAPSNQLLISLMNINSYNLDEVKIYPNPSTGLINLDWGSQSVNVKVDVYSISGQGLLHEDVQNQTKKVLDLSHFANGNYYIVIRDNTGKTGTVKITLSK